MLPVNNDSPFVPIVMLFLSLVPSSMVFAKISPVEVMVEGTIMVMASGEMVHQKLVAFPSTLEPLKVLVLSKVT